jgi:hypothetical protein
MTRDSPDLLANCKLKPRPRWAPEHGSLSLELTWMRREAFSTSRHSLGFYHSVGQTARYCVPVAASQNKTLEDVIEHAVAQAILAHPILQVGIKDEHTKEPYFVHLPTVDLSQIVRWENVGTEADRNDALCRILGDRHSTLWPDIAHRPGYEVVVLRRSPNASSKAEKDLTLDIIFAWHHALGDGTSGAIFHRTLIDALNKPSPLPPFSPSTHILTLTRTPLVPPQESLINFHISWTFLLKVVWGEFAPSFLRPAAEPIWTGKPVTPDHNTTRVRLITFPAATVSSLLAQTRKKSTTLTPLLHILVLYSLSRRIPQTAGSGFTSTTPISLRRHIPISGPVNPDTTMGVIICADSHLFPSSTVDQLRANPSDESRIWSLTSTLGAELKAKVASLPADDSVGMLPWVTDFHKRWLDRLGKQREMTWEVSNIGAIDMGTGGDWKVQRMVFSQSQSVAGAAIGVSAVAVRGSELAVTLAWQEGIVEEEVVDGVAGDLERWLTGLADRGRFGFA